jgi:hypothetical protein
MVVIVSFLCLFTSGCISRKCVKYDRQATGSVDTCVSNCLYQIGLALMDEAGDRNHFVWSFSYLKEAQTEPGIFSCCNTTNPSTASGSVDKWTDYILIGNTPVDWIPQAPIVISPPENHGGKYGYVLYPGLTISRFPADTVRALIREPWCLATNESSDVVEFYKTSVHVQVPDRFRSIYTNR